VGPRAYLQEAHDEPLPDDEVRARRGDLKASGFCAAKTLWKNARSINLASRPNP
jgi:hypothetical protein